MIFGSAASTIHSGSHGRDERLRDLTVAVRAFVVGVVIVGAGVIAFAASNMRVERPGLLVLMVTLALLTSTVKLTLPLSRGVSTLSVSNALTFAAMLLLDGGSAVAIAVVSAWGQCTFRMRSRNPLHRTLFSVATLAISAFAAAVIFDTMIDVGLLAPSASRTSALAGLSLLDLAQAAVPSALVYFFVNTVLVATAVALTNGQAMHRVWLKGYLWSAPGYFVAAAVGCIALSADRWTQSWGVLMAVPLYVTYRSYREFIGRIEEERAQVRQLSEVQLATIEALAIAIEVKDHTSHSQIQRFQVYAEGLARSLGIGDDDVRAIRTAALLHDIGNLAMPEHILNKAGALTSEEFSKLQIHPRVGADIVGSVPFPYPVAPLILAHHEHWNGSGYPDGLAGEAIPAGARVLTVVDFFTALLSERPYRPAKSFGEAIALLHECAGTKLDPGFAPGHRDPARTRAAGPRRARQHRRVATGGRHGTHRRPERARRHRRRTARGQGVLRDRPGARLDARPRRHVPAPGRQAAAVDAVLHLCPLPERRRPRPHAVRACAGSVCGALLRLEPLHFADIARSVSRLGGAEPFAARLVSALAVGNRVIGALGVFNDEADAYDANTAACST